MTREARLLLFALLLTPVAACAQSSRTSYELDLRLDLEARKTFGRMVLRPAEDMDVVRLNLAAGNGRMMELANLALEGRAVPVPATGGDGIVQVSLDGAATLSVEYVTPLDSLLAQPFGYYLMGPLGPRRFAYPELLDPSGRAVEADFSATVDHPTSLTRILPEGRV